VEGLFLGLPLPLVGSGHFAARCSLGPSAAKPPWSAAFGGPATAPQPAAASPPAKPFRSGIASQSFIERAKPQTEVWGFK